MLAPTPAHRHRGVTRFVKRPRPITGRRSHLRLRQSVHACVAPQCRLKPREIRFRPDSRSGDVRRSWHCGSTKEETMQGTLVCAVADGAGNDDAVAQSVAVSERLGLRLVLAHVVDGIAGLDDGDGESITM